MRRNGRKHEKISGKTVSEISGDSPVPGRFCTTYLQNLISNHDLTNASDAIENALSNVKTLQAAQLFLTLLPILLIYPFLQKYFTKGLTVGAVKA